jgi:hypothetical protein
MVPINANNKLIASYILLHFCDEDIITCLIK